MVRERERTLPIRLPEYGIKLRFSFEQGEFVYAAQSVKLKMLPRKRIIERFSMSMNFFEYKRTGKMLSTKGRESK